MKNPVLNKEHLKEYFLYGSIAALVYMVPVLFFLYQNKYENLYYLFAGSGLFMFVIFYYAYRLLFRPYDGKRAVSMLIAGHLATIIGVVISTVLIIICFFFFFPNVLAVMPTDKVVENAPDSLQPRRPTGLLLMILAAAIFGNTGVGSFISVITSYAGKRDQTKDKPVLLETDVPGSKTSL